MRYRIRALRWPLLFLFLVLLTAGAILLVNPAWIRVERLELDLVQSSQEDLLFQRIKKTLEPQYKRFEGRYFWQVPLSQVFELTTRDKRVKKVNIYREFPFKVRVEIEPYTPVLAYLSTDGRIYPIATDATLLPPLPPVDAPDLPFVRGEDLKDEPKLREAAIDLYMAIPDEGPLSKKQISEIFYTRKEGFKLFVAGSSSEVKMGDNDFSPKVSRVQKVLSYLDSQNIKGRVIDARFSKKVVVRVRNNP